MSNETGTPNQNALIEGVSRTYRGGGSEQLLVWGLEWGAGGDPLVADRRQRTAI